MEEILWSPPLLKEMVSAVTDVIAGTAPNGIHYSFRLFQWMNNWGICDEDIQKVLLPAGNGQSLIKIDFERNMIWVRAPALGWKFYDLELNPLFAGEVIHSRDDVIRLINGNKRNGKPLFS